MLQRGMEEAYVVVCTADKSRTGGKAGRINFQNDSQRIIWGMFCDLSGAALAFPGYVFITSREPEALFFCLKQVPVMARMMVDEDCFFLSVEEDEAEFLEQIMNRDHVIGLSYLSTDGRGNILQVSGPLEKCIDEVEKYRFGKRYVLVRVKLHGEEKTVLFGIVLNEDICQGMRGTVAEFWRGGESAWHGIC